MRRTRGNPHWRRGRARSHDVLVKTWRRLSTLFPSTEFGADARKERRDFLQRIDAQVQRARAKLEADIRMWSIKKIEYTSLIPWDTFATRLEEEEKVIYIFLD